MTPPSTFADWFSTTFGEAFPLKSLAPQLETTDVDGVWSSTRAPELLPSALMVPAFPDIGRDYAVAGSWGYGLASHAFYLVRKYGAHEHFFRLSFGGAYGDARSDAAEVVRFLRGYARFLDEREGTLAASHLTCSMGNCRGTLTQRSADGTLTKHTDTGLVFLKPGAAPPPPSTWWVQLAALGSR